MNRQPTTSRAATLTQRADNVRARALADRVARHREPTADAKRRARNKRKAQKGAAK